MKSFLNYNMGSFLSLVFAVSLARFFHGVSVVEPIVATILLASLYYPRQRRGFYIPLLAFLAVDSLMGFKDSYQVQIASYWGLYFVFLEGSYGLRFFAQLKRIYISDLLSVLWVVLLASLTFFIVYSFSLWVFSDFYSSHFLEVLKENLYSLKYRILGDVFYSTLLFSAYVFLKKLKDTLLQKNS